MTQKIVRLVAVLGMAATLVAVAAPAHAAAPPPAHAGIQATPFCPLPYLATDFGPIAQCTEMANIKGRAGYYSPFTKGFSPTSDYFALFQPGWLDRDVQATDGVYARARGYAVLVTPFGGTVFATQYLGNHGRWGSFNVHTQLFYPSSGWHQVVP